jgi:hypothetical protein
MAARDPFVSYTFAFMLIVVGFFAVAALSDINKSLQEVVYELRLQTTQHSWLVEHYAKPVRPIYPWEDDK